jgi:murein DD-endopeptidase MepM/ murein hydrolase activator NlpD
MKAIILQFLRLSVSLQLLASMWSAAAEPAPSCASVNFGAHGPYHPVMTLPAKYHVHDFTSNDDPLPDGSWSVGKYDEVRPTLYATEMFQDATKSVDGFAGVRNVHVGLDIGGPTHTPVHAWYAGSVLHSGYNPDAGDYGWCVVTEHEVGGVAVYSLYGHLDESTATLSPVGRQFEAGAVLGGLGERHENGGWPPHLHFQLALERPTTHDLPGVVSQEDRAAALLQYPDPRLVLGPLYE